MNKKLLGMVALACIVGFAGCDDSSSDDAKKACGSVAHDAMTCNADGTQLAKCNDGKLEDLTGEGKCTENQVCAITDGKAACKDKSEDTQLDCDNAKHGELVCKGDKMAKCVNGDIVDAEGAEACATGKVCGKGADGKATCFDAGTRPCGSTAHGAKACNGEKIATCNDGKLVNDEGQGVTQCIDRKTHCVANDAEIACVAFKKCGDVDHYAHACDGEKMFWCYDGEKQEPAAPFQQCTGDTVCRINEFSQPECVERTACDELKNGEKKCNDEGTQILVCTNGELKEATGDAACTAEQICVKDGASVKCDKKPEQSIPALHKEMMNLIPDDCATTDPEIVAKSIKVQGTITAISSTDAIVYIQDSTVADGKHAAVQVFCNNEKSSGEKHLCSDSFDTFKKSFAIGDRIEVIADGVGVNKCQPRIEMKTNKIVVNVIEKAGTQIKPIILKASDIASSNIKNEYNGTLATVNGLTITGKSGANRNAKDGDNSVLTVLSRLMIIKGGTFESGTYNITGIVANFKTAGLMPRSESDFAEIK